MATKNLARTVIEGGRARFNKFQRRHSNRAARRRAKQYTHRLRDDLDLFESTVVRPRESVCKIFDDKLAPAERWLKSHVGQPWDRVHGKIKQILDTRTIAGQHIVYDHLLPSVAVTERHDCRWYRFYVDDQGILHQRARRRRVRPVPPGKVRRSRDEIAAWSGARKVGKRGAYLFWFEPIAVTREPCVTRWCPRGHLRAPGSNARMHLVSGGTYRQTHRLCEGDIEYWNQLMADAQHELWFGNADG